MSGAEASPYHVSCSQNNLNQLRLWDEKAKGLGVQGQYRAALAAICEKLSTVPLNWGEPSYHLQHLELFMFLGLHDMILVYYGVDEQRRIVYIKEFRIIPGHALDEA